MKMLMIDKFNIIINSTSDIFILIATMIVLGMFILSIIYNKKQIYIS